VYLKLELGRQPLVIVIEHRDKVGVEVADSGIARGAFPRER
jgi:hypothetical protein